MRQVAYVVIGGLVLLCFACGRLPGLKRNTPTADGGDKTLALPEFSNSVKLSETAEKQLNIMQESALVIAHFDGDPLSVQGKYNAPMRDV